MAKIAHNGELDPGQRNPPGNWLMGHITSHSMGKHYLGPFKSPSGTISGQLGSKNTLFYGRNSPKWRVGSKAGNPSWKLANGPYPIPIHGKTLLRAI